MRSKEGRIQKASNHWSINRGDFYYEDGVIIAVSHQGDYTFAMVRRIGDKVIDVDGNIVYINNYIFGNILNIPEKELTMAESFIPCNIDQSLMIVNFNTLVGKKVRVMMESNFPKMVMIDNVEKECRIIDKSYIYRARMTNDDFSITHKDALKYLGDNGFDEAIASAIADDKIKVGTLCYGDYVSRNRTSAEDKKGIKIVDDNINLVTGLPVAKLKEKSCYQFPVALGGI